MKPVYPVESDMAACSQKLHTDRNLSSGSNRGPWSFEAVAQQDMILLDITDATPEELRSGPDFFGPNINYITEGKVKTEWYKSSEYFKSSSRGHGHGHRPCCRLRCDSGFNASDSLGYSTTTNKKLVIENVVGNVLELLLCSFESSLSSQVSNVSIRCNI